MRTLIDSLRQARVRKLFVPGAESYLAGEGDAAVAQLRMLAVAGWRRTSRSKLGMFELRRVGRDSAPGDQ
jgi:hypothetical protein